MSFWKRRYVDLHPLILLSGILLHLDERFREVDHGFDRYFIQWSMVPIFFMLSSFVRIAYPKGTLVSLSVNYVFLPSSFSLLANLVSTTFGSGL